MPFLLRQSSKKSSADVESDGPPLLKYNGKDGRFKDEKDLKVHKRFFVDVTRKYPDSQVLICGNGSLDILRRFVCFLQPKAVL